MNEEFTKHYTNVHIPPAVGDEGQALGTYICIDYVIAIEQTCPMFMLLAPRL